MSSAYALNLSSVTISPWHEMGAYEALWMEKGATFKTIAEKFRRYPGSLPSEVLGSEEHAEQYAKEASAIFRRAGIEPLGIRIHGAGEYPQKLRDAVHPIELLYFQGWWNLAETPCIAIVGAREATPEGLRSAAHLAKRLVEDKYTIVSGLAKGIDTAAQMSALKSKGRTVAVIGTPLSNAYPPENKGLQAHLAKHHLVISQVPACRYSVQHYAQNRLFFPERNITMSALTEATVIVEASDTSGTLTQARAALQQGRKLFILDRCFQRPGLTWPSYYAARGAVRIKSYRELRKHLGQLPSNPQTPVSD